MKKLTLRSGDLARLTGVSADTIRHYEKLGILPPSQRTPWGYRIYTPAAVERVRVAQRAVRMGFSLAELSRVLQTRDGGGIPCHDVLRLAEEKVLAIGKQIRELQETERSLRALVREWRNRLKASAGNRKAMLLDSLMEVPPRNGAIAKIGRRTVR